MRILRTGHALESQKTFGNHSENSILRASQTLESQKTLGNLTDNANFEDQPRASITECTWESQRELIFWVPERIIHYKSSAKTWIWDAITQKALEIPSENANLWCQKVEFIRNPQRKYESVLPDTEFIRNAQRKHESALPEHRIHWKSSAKTWNWGART